MCVRACVRSCAVTREQKDQKHTVCQKRVTKKDVKVIKTKRKSLQHIIDLFI